MAIIKCKMCGGDLRLEEGSTVCECEYCGTRQTVPSADNEKKLTLFSRAGRLLRGCEFDKAAGVFETIVADFPEEAEAYWGLVLCKYGIEYVDDPATGKKIPTCHRSSFDSVLDDPNFEQACENTDAIARRVYRDEARQIEELRKQIIEVSGKEEPYDIFISYKETGENGDRTLDSVIAQDIYTELTEKGYRVFFSRISLEDKLGTEFEPYIFAALNSAKVMLVVGTDYENFDAVWVKNEWSRFLKLIASGQKKTLIPVFKNMDAYDMPKEFAKLAAQDMGKVGAMQDLVRGVEKLINKKAALVKETVKETVVVQQSGDGAARITAAMDRGFMALEDNEWDKAVSFFDQALSLDAKNARAYYGMALAKAQCRDADVYINMLCSGTPRAENIELPRDEKHIREAAEKYAVPGYLNAEEIRALYDYTPSYHSTLQSQKQLSAQAKKKYESDRNLTRARQFAAGEFKTELEDLRKKLLERLDKAVRDAEESSEKTKQQAEKTYKSFLTNKDRLAEEKFREAEAKRDADYQDAIQRFEQATSIENYQNTKPLFIGLVPYKDSAEMAKRCDVEAARLEREEAEEAERKRKAEAEEAERQRLNAELAAKKKKARTRLCLVLALLAVVIAVAGYLAYTNIVVPYKDYKVAEALFAEGRYNESLAIYEMLDSFIDSKTKVEEVRKAILEQDYVNASAFLEAGDYTKALDAFQALGNYKDSEEKYEEVKAATMEQDYITAMNLFNSGEYKKAFAAFSSLGSYKDSSEKMEEAKKIYNAAHKKGISTAYDVAELLPGTYKIGIALYAFDDNFMTLYRNEMLDYFKSLETDDVKFDVTIVDGKRDMAEQNNQIDNFISQGMDAIILNLVQTSAADVEIDKIVYAGIPCILINREPLGDKGNESYAGILNNAKVCYVGTDARQAGTYQGEIIAELPNHGDINGDGKVSYIMIEGDPENIDAQYRTEYSVKALTDAGIEVECLDDQIGNWAQAKGQDICATDLARFGDAIEVVFCNNDAMALGAATAIKAADRTVGKDIYLVGIDALDVCVEMVNEGTMTGTVMNDAVGQSHAAVNVTLDALAGLDIDNYYWVNYVKITK